MCWAQCDLLPVQLGFCVAVNWLWKAETGIDGSAVNWAKTLLADTSFDYRWPKKTIRLGTGWTVLYWLCHCCSSDDHRWPAPAMSYKSRSYPSNLLLEVPCRLSKRGSAAIFWIIRGWCCLGSKPGTNGHTPAEHSCSANGPPVLITSYCYGYLHAEAWALSRAF